MKPPGPYTRRNALDRLDRRSVSFKFMQQERAGLIAHCGGNPSTVQLALIDQIAWLRLHLRTMTNKMMAAGGNLTELDSRTFLAWNNSPARPRLPLGTCRALQGVTRLPAAALRSN